METQVHIDLRREGVDRLGHFTRTLVADGVTDEDTYRRWRSLKANAARMDDALGFPARSKLASATALIGLTFHPTRPLVKYNYTKVAHATLHGAMSHGWTPAARMSRGSIFDHAGRAVAVAFPKFHNYGQDPETMSFPKGPCVATVKADGHLGINYSYGETRGAQDLHVTTRGFFTSRTSRLAADILARHVREEGWDLRFPSRVTVLTEVVGPDTHIHLDYPGENRYVLIGAVDRDTLEDFSYEKLLELGAYLGIPVTEREEVTDPNVLLARVSDLSIRGKEGYVLRFGDLRMKIKYAAYINMMVEANLSYPYLMARMRDGKLDDMIRNLDEEVLDRAHQMIGALTRVQYMRGKPKARREYLYGLLPPEKRTTYGRGLCGKFLRFIDAGWNPPVDGEPADNDSD